MKHIQQRESKRLKNKSMIMAKCEKCGQDVLLQDILKHKCVVKNA